MAKKPPAAKPAATQRRQRADWDAIEPHYRAGIRALKDIGAQFGVSDAAIIKHAKANNWTRNLKAKIQARADAKVSAAMVSAEVSAEAKLTENLRVEVESEVQARIRLAHRSDVGRYRKLAGSMVEELAHQTENSADYMALAEVLAGDDEGDDMRKIRLRRLNDMLDRAVSLPARVKTMKEAAETLRVLIALEREAFGLNTEASGTGDYEQRVQDLAGALDP